MAVQPAIAISHPITFMGILGGTPAIKIDVFGSIFQYKENNSMVEEALEEYALASSEAAHEDLGEHALMVLMASGG